MARFDFRIQANIQLPQLILTHRHSICNKSAMEGVKQSLNLKSFTLEAPVSVFVVSPLFRFGNEQFFINHCSEDFSPAVAVIRQIDFCPQRFVSRDEVPVVDDPISDGRQTFFILPLLGYIICHHYGHCEAYQNNDRDESL
jgi:hypothetical protein